MTRVRKEVSSGGVLCRKGEKGNIEVALISRRTQRGDRVWCLPKGKVERGEDPQETALREVREETGMEGKILADLGTINYWFYSPEHGAKVNKTVYFYLMEYKRGSPEDHDWEVEEVKWHDIDDAIGKLAYKTEKETVQKAKKFLDSGKEVKG